MINTYANSSKCPDLESYHGSIMKSLNFYIKPLFPLFNSNVSLAPFVVNVSFGNNESMIRWNNVRISMACQLQDSKDCPVRPADDGSVASPSVFHQKMLQFISATKEGAGVVAPLISETSHGIHTATQYLSPITKLPINISLTNLDGKLNMKQDWTLAWATMVSDVDKRLAEMQISFEFDDRISKGRTKNASISPLPTVLDALSKKPLSLPKSFSEDAVFKNLPDLSDFEPTVYGSLFVIVGRKATANSMMMAETTLDAFADSSTGNNTKMVKDSFSIPGIDLSIRIIYFLFLVFWVLLGTFDGLPRGTHFLNIIVFCI